MEALMDVQKSLSSLIGTDNLRAFNEFKRFLKAANRQDNGDLTTLARITCYGRSGIHSYAGKILLINHGVNIGRIWIDDGEEGFGPENILLGSVNKEYSLGRSTKTLVIENHNLEFALQRIDIEEIFVLA